jgi:organic hydroperoxide reductase OsmC/OhrA
MSEHRARIAWRRTTPDFVYETYDRAHDWHFDSGVTVPGSASPEFRGRPERVDPEEGFVASLSSCHMLTFLAIAARKRLVLDSYDDDATGFMRKNEEGRLAITKVILRPRIVWAPGTTVAPAELDRMHHQSHLECFIANSVKTEIIVEPRDV